MMWWKSKEERARIANEIEIANEHSKWYNQLSPSEQQLYNIVTESLLNQVWESTEISHIMMTSEELGLLVDSTGIHSIPGSRSALLEISTAHWKSQVREAFNRWRESKTQSEELKRLEVVRDKVKALTSPEIKEDLQEPAKANISVCIHDAIGGNSGVLRPTVEQCEVNAVVWESTNRVSIACWYPQMGGYIARAVVTFDKSRRNNDCFDVDIWHDGEFPLDDGEGEPAHLHHCDPQQFVDFGNLLLKLMGAGK